MRVRRLLPYLAVVSALAAGGVVTAAATSSASTRSAATPSAAGAAAGHATAQYGIPTSTRIGGTVAGLSGAAAEKAFGSDIARYRDEALRRIKDATARAGSTGSAGSSVAAAPAASPSAKTEHPARGTYVYARSGGKGVKATQSVFNGPGSTTRDGNNVVYAPTLMAPGGSCIEMTTAYTSTGPVLWAWNWCGASGPGKTVKIDAGFMAKYTTVVNGLPSYSVDIHQTSATGNQWTAYLYNVQTKAWDVFYTRSGAFTLGPSYKVSGWDIFELYFTRDASNKAYYCTSMKGKTFASSGLQVKVNNTWSAAGPGNAQPATGGDLGCPSLTFTSPNLSQWTASIAG